MTTRNKTAKNQKPPIERFLIRFPINRKMKKEKNKTKDLTEEIITSIIGKPGEKLIETLYHKKNINEFLIAKKLGLTINQTRNLLYKLSDKDLIRFIRKKDSKKGGWYTYFWTLNEKRCLELLKELKSNKIKELESTLQKRRDERFYYCPTSNLEYNEEQALEHNFICPETGEVLQLKDNKDEVSRLELEIAKLKLSLEEVSIEFDELDRTEAKERERKMKREIKKKEMERKAKREKMKRQRKREEKKKKSKPKKKASKKQKKKK